ncbi:hypothetical protein [Vibrio hippocampi]|uniref:Outer membrane protein beta-barrel domain-containing protein n=1 Tax=Vibrio hippocampi TaxID=654686 RepID=A0ABM8ZHS3_9VIBR|nr:hypothetical protein [Vibrio hippocampi]CAH0525688.1 hypothetical protein VHP8226_01218 [Vibrio hippocampi]
MKIIHLTLMAAALLSAQTKASTIHFSPEIKSGPYAGSGISGYGLQLGLSDLFGLESLYFSYTDTNAEFLDVDQDQITTYRLGGQIQLVESPKMSLQLEAGIATYNGEREYIFGSKRYLDQDGFSTSVAWAIELNQHIAAKIALDLNYLNSSSTFLSSSIAPTISTGFIFRF